MLPYALRLAKLAFKIRKLLAAAVDHYVSSPSETFLFQFAYEHRETGCFMMALGLPAGGGNTNDSSVAGTVEGSRARGQFLEGG